MKSISRYLTVALLLLGSTGALAQWDLSGSIFVNGIVPENSAQVMQISAFENNGVSSGPYFVEVTLDPTQTFQSATVPPVSVVGNTYRWEFLDLSGGQNLFFLNFVPTAQGTFTATSIVGNINLPLPPAGDTVSGNETGFATQQVTPPNPPINGSCGTSNGGAFPTAPTTNLCATGGSIGATGGGAAGWSWTCAGQFGGSTADCAADDSSVDAEITKMASTLTPELNQPFEYTVTGVNNSGNPALDAVITDVLDSDLTFNSAVPAPTSIVGNTYTWDIGDLAAGASVPIVINVTPTVLTAIDNTATIATSSADADAGNDSATVSVTAYQDGACGADNGAGPFIVEPTALCAVGTASLVTEGENWDWTCDGVNAGSSPAVCSAVNDNADLVISKTAADPQPLVDQPTSFTITTTNNGPAVARNVVVSDTLPSGLTFNSAVPVASLAGSVASWNLGDIAVGASVIITIDATPTELGTLTNTAVVSTDSEDDLGGSGDGDTATAVIDPFANGACGISNGGSFGNAPTGGLCSAGSSSAFAALGDGSGWSWSCDGTTPTASVASCAAVRAEVVPTMPLQALLAMMLVMAGLGAYTARKGRVAR